jgi:hypothetical protein
VFIEIRRQFCDLGVHAILSKPGTEIPQKYKTFTLIIYKIKRELVLKIKDENYIGPPD